MGESATASPVTRWCERHFRPLAAVVLIVAACNLFIRLDQEIVTEWDESLYAISAAETARHGHWIGTTFLGELDYYNTKPPLNVWLIAAAFKIFGTGLTSLRLPSALAAWLTVLVLLLWARRSFGSPVALMAGLVLSTTFGFLYVHSGRSGNTDALFTLFMLLVVVTLWSADDRPSRLIWLGPLLAATFLLRGLAALMPLALIAAVVLADWRRLRGRAAPLAWAGLVAAVPVAAWVIARWRLDGWEFIGRMVQYDLVARTASALEGHEGGLLYYLDALQKNQFDWLLAAATALILFPPRLSRHRLWPASADGRYQALVLAAWVGVTLVVPTLMQTKVPWYLNPFFPIFALMVGAAVVHALALVTPPLTWRYYMLVAVLLLCTMAAEARLIWYSHTMRDLDDSAQGLLLDERRRLAGRRVFQREWPRAERFVLEHVVSGEAAEAADAREFLARAAPGDYLLQPRAVPQTLGGCVGSHRRFVLCPYPD